MYVPDYYTSEFGDRLQCRAFVNTDDGFARAEEGQTPDFWGLYYKDCNGHYWHLLDRSGATIAEYADAWPVCECCGIEPSVAVTWIGDECMSKWRVCQYCGNWDTKFFYDVHNNFSALLTIDSLTCPACNEHEFLSVAEGAKRGFTCTACNVAKSRTGVPTFWSLLDLVPCN